MVQPTLANIDFPYRGGYPIPLHDALAKFAVREGNIVRIETAIALGRAPVEAIAGQLIAEFGEEVENTSVKQAIGSMVRIVAEANGFVVDRRRLRITRPNLFASGMTFRRAGQLRNRGQRLNAADRRSCLGQFAKDPFNCWLDAQVRTEQGELDLERLWSFAGQYGISRTRRRWEPPLQRLLVGVLLRPLVPTELYANDQEPHAEPNVGQTHQV